MRNFLLEKVFSEHHLYPNGEDVSAHGSFLREIHFRGKQDCKCIEIKKIAESSYLCTSYFVGVDWLKDGKAVYVEPKYLHSDKKTDYFAMLFTALKHPNVETKDLFEIKFEDNYIEIYQSQDLLTPLLITHFLRLVKELVRKGLKKSYYKVERNLNSRVKGKVLVGQTIKKNIVQNKPLQTFCQYEEFGFDSLENRLLKKALLFVQRYLPSFHLPQAELYTTELFNFILPAFISVSEKIELNEIKHFKSNSFYKEYTEAIHLAKLILKRFGYNINTIQSQKNIMTPPFWIDMSRLYELYVLGLLKDTYGEDVEYHLTTYGNELDFLLKKQGMEMVIDAKYKPKYQRGLDHSDIRQVSGYARLEKVYNKLTKSRNENIDCLIIYPDIEKGIENFRDVSLKSDENKLNEYVGIYKIGIQLPTK